MIKSFVFSFQGFFLMGREAWHQARTGQVRPGQAGIIMHQSLDALMRSGVSLVFPLSFSLTCWKGRSVTRLKTGCQSSFALRYFMIHHFRLIFVVCSDPVINVRTTFPFPYLSVRLLRCFSAQLFIHVGRPKCVFFRMYNFLQIRWFSLSFLAISYQQN